MSRNNFIYEAMHGPRSDLHDMPMHAACATAPPYTVPVAVPRPSGPAPALYGYVAFPDPYGVHRTARPSPNCRLACEKHLLLSPS